MPVCLCRLSLSCRKTGLFQCQISFLECCQISIQQLCPLSHKMLPNEHTAVMYLVLWHITKWAYNRNLNGLLKHENQIWGHTHSFLTLEMVVVILLILPRFFNTVTAAAVCFVFFYFAQKKVFSLDFYERFLLYIYFLF